MTRLNVVGNVLLSLLARALLARVSATCARVPGLPKRRDSALRSRRARIEIEVDMFVEW